MKWVLNHYLSNHWLDKVKMVGKGPQSLQWEALCISWEPEHILLPMCFWDVPYNYLSLQVHLNPLPVSHPNHVPTRASTNSPRFSSMILYSLSPKSCLDAISL